MTDPDRASEPTGGVDRRTLLKGTAAAGLAGSALSGTANAWENTVVFESVSDEFFKYRVTVTGEIEFGDRADRGDDFILDEDTAEGQAAGGGKDSFRFTGKIEDLDLKGPGKVFVNGDLVRDTTEDLPNTITVEAQGPTVDYKFRVSGTVRKGDRSGSSDRVLDSNVVKGNVGGGGVDDFHYSGSLAFEHTDGPLRVCLDINDN